MKRLFSEQDVVSLAYNLASRFRRDINEQGDLVGEALLKWASVAKQNERYYSRFVHRTLANAMIDALRKQKAPPLEIDLLRSEPSTMAAYNHIEIDMAIRPYLERLSEKDREIILCWAMTKNQQVGAAELGMGYSTYKMKVIRIKRLLQQMAVAA